MSEHSNERSDAGGRTVSFRRMQDGTIEDNALLLEFEAEYARALPSEFI